MLGDRRQRPLQVAALDAADRLGRRPDNRPIAARRTFRLVRLKVGMPAGGPVSRGATSMPSLVAVLYLAGIVSRPSTFFVISTL
jgi:hypothetical protein